MAGANMRTAIYPGSFNPWHQGHEDILKKALQVFDKVIIAKGFNPEKDTLDSCVKASEIIKEVQQTYQDKVDYAMFSCLLVDYVDELDVVAVIRGLRNGHDLQYEMNQQYWNEDLGLKIPTVYFICDRSLSHISSSAIRAVEKFK